MLSSFDLSPSVRQRCGTCHWGQGHDRDDGMRCTVPLPPKIASIVEHHRTSPEYWCVMWRISKEAYDQSRV